MNCRRNMVVCAHCLKPKSTDAVRRVLDVFHIAHRYFNRGVLAVSKIFATLVELCDKIGIDSSLVTSEEGSAFMVSDLVKFLILEFE